MKLLNVTDSEMLPLSSFWGGEPCQIQCLLGISRRADLVDLSKKVREPVAHLRLAVNPQWLSYSSEPPAGYTMEEWNSCWPYPPGVSVNHNWDLNQLINRCGDVLGLPKESSPKPQSVGSVVSNSKRSHEEADFEDDEAELDSRRPAKRRRVFKFDALSPKEKEKVAEIYEMMKDK